MESPKKSSSSEKLTMMLGLTSLIPIPAFLLGLLIHNGDGSFGILYGVIVFYGSIIVGVLSAIAGLIVGLYAFSNPVAHKGKLILGLLLNSWIIFFIGFFFSRNDSRKVAESNARTERLIKRGKTDPEWWLREERTVDGKVIKKSKAFGRGIYADGSLVENGIDVTFDIGPVDNPYGSVLHKHISGGNSAIWEDYFPSSAHPGPVTLISKHGECKGTKPAPSPTGVYSDYDYGDIVVRCSPTNQ